MPLYALKYNDVFKILLKKIIYYIEWSFRYTIRCKIGSSTFILSLYYCPIKTIQFNQDHVII